jgi:hypothetical protein
MNNEFVKSFMSTLMYNLATLVAIIVGVFLFIKNSATVWYNNGGKETLLRYTQRVLLFLNVTTEKAYYGVCDVTLSELAQ